MEGSEIKAESILNREDDSLPYAYFNPETDGKLTWMCGEDAEGRITSVFCMDLGQDKDKRCQYLGNIDEARYIRKELVDNGWKKLVAPEVTFTFPGEKEGRQLSRKEKRFLKRKIEKISNQNPFEQ